MTQYPEFWRHLLGSSAPVFDCDCGGLVLSTVDNEHWDGCLTDRHFCNRCGWVTIAKVRQLSSHWRTCPNHPDLTVR